MNNPFLKRLIKDDRENVFHTSTYGRAQNGGGIGTASAEGFGRRLEIERNRKVVEKYGNSQIANSGAKNGPRAKTYTAPEIDESKTAATATPPTMPGAPRVPNRLSMPRKRV